jgi:NADH-quinone oxidoreductase subunit N
MFDLLLNFSYEIFLTFLLIYSLLFSYFRKASWDSNVYCIRAYSSELSLCFAVLLVLMLILFQNGELHYHLYENHDRPFYTSADFHTNPFLFSSKIFAILVTSCCLLLSFVTIRTSHFTRIEYPFFFLSALLAILFLISSYHLLYIYLSLELLNFSLYLIIGGKVFSSLANEASQRYFVYSSYASALFLLGIALLYGLFGTLNLHELSLLAHQTLAPFNQKMLLSLGLLFLYTGLLFKLSIFPFHFWVSEVYEGSPLPSILFLSTAPKIAFVALYLKLTFTLAIHIPLLLSLLQLLSLLSIAVGIIAGLYEYRLKRFLAYSTISNMGFIILSLSLLNPVALTAGLLYLVVYLITTLGFLGLLMLFHLQINLAKENPNLESFELKEIFSIQHFKDHPTYTFAFTTVILSLAGIPPLAGFFLKFYLLKACLIAGNPFLAFLVFLLSVLALGFYLRLLRFLYVTPLRLDFHQKPKRQLLYILFATPIAALILLLLILFFLIGYGLFFNNLLYFCLTQLVLSSFSF